MLSGHDLLGYTHYQNDSINHCFFYIIFHHEFRPVRDSIGGPDDHRSYGRKLKTQNIQQNPNELKLDIKANGSLPQALSNVGWRQCYMGKISTRLTNRGIIV